MNRIRTVSQSDGLEGGATGDDGGAVGPLVGILRRALRLG